MSTKTLKLYTAPRCAVSYFFVCVCAHCYLSFFPNPQRLRLMMLEKGVASHYEEVVMHLTGFGEQRGWQHLKRNAWGEAPTLELEDSSTLSEAAAIARYIDDSHPGRKILGETVLEQALDQQWDNRVWVHLLYNLVTAFHVLVCRLHLSSSSFLFHII
jgi:glutathione S-transferase